MSAPRIDEYHVPVVASQGPGRWGVYCLACSTQAEDYVYPCRLAGGKRSGGFPDPYGMWPPAVIVDAEPTPDP